jgi:hypothetical protein
MRYAGEAMLKWERRSLARSIVGLFVWMTTVADIPLLSMRLLFGETLWTCLFDGSYLIRAYGIAPSADMPLLSMRLLFGENHLRSYRDIWRVKFPTVSRVAGHFEDAKRACRRWFLGGTLLCLGWVGEEVQRTATMKYEKPDSKEIKSEDEIFLNRHSSSRNSKMI